MLTVATSLRIFSRKLLKMPNNTISFSNGTQVRYFYSADGTKLRQTVKSLSATTPPVLAIRQRSDYLGPVHYEDPDGDGSAQRVLLFAQHEEGRIRPSGGEILYEYVLTDHLGNTRITFGDADADGDPDLLQENHYYPFGLAMTLSGTTAAAPPNDYLYNGKELQDELGLGWLDYGARMYDASIGRWNGVDAMAEKRSWVSPWQYAQNNPISRIDPDGNLDKLPTKDERDAAVAKAKEYAEKSTGTSSSYVLGDKGAPGEAVDCSGLVSGCIKAAGLPDPAGSGEGKGTTRIKNNTTPIENVNDIEAGYGVFIDFSANGGTGHTGLITEVTRNDEGEVTSYEVIHSGSSTGPTEITVTIGGTGYYDTNNSGGNKVSGFYKWDTPDSTTTPVSSLFTVQDVITPELVRQDETGRIQPFIPQNVPNSAN